MFCACFIHTWGLPELIQEYHLKREASFLLLSLFHSRSVFFCRDTLNVLSFAAFGDMFPHKHVASKKLPFPPIPGWDQDTNPWDDYLYPPLNLKANELSRHRGESVNLLWIESSNFFVLPETFVQVSQRST